MVGPELDITLRAIDEASKVIEDASAKIKESMGQIEDANKRVKDSGDRVTASSKDLAIGLSSVATAGFALYMGIERIEHAQVTLDRANLNVTRSLESVDQAQKNYTEAVQKFGSGSEQAKDAADKLKIAQDALKVANERVEMAQSNVTSAMASFALSIVPTVITALSGAQKAIQAVGGALDWLEKNPIVLVVAGITTLITTLVTLYEKCEWFRNGINAIGQAITNFFVPPVKAAETATKEFTSAQLAWLATFEYSKRLLPDLVNAVNGYYNTALLAKSATSGFDDSLKALNQDYEKARNELLRQIDALSAIGVTQLGRDRETKAETEREQERTKALKGYTDQLEQLDKDYQTDTAILKQREAEEEAMAEKLKETADAYEHLASKYGILKAEASDTLPLIASWFDQAFNAADFENAIGFVQAFADKYGISLNDAMNIVEDFNNKQKDIPKTIEEQLIGKAQKDLETFTNCVSGKMVDINKNTTDLWDNLVSDTNDLIEKGLLGQAQNNIQAFVDCSTNKQAKMVTDIDGYLKDLTSEYDANVTRITDLVSKGALDEAAIIEAKNLEIMTKIKQLEDWRNMITAAGWATTSDIVKAAIAEIAAEMSKLAVVPAIPTPIAEAVEALMPTATPQFADTLAHIKRLEIFEERMGMQAGGIVTKPTFALIGERGPEAVMPLEKMAGRSMGATIEIHGPLLVIEGSADRATAEVAAKIVMQGLKSVIVEPTSIGAALTQKRIRRGEVL